MIKVDIAEQSSSIFEPNSRLLKICLLVMFLLAALIRRDEIQAPGFAPTREYTSAIIARAFYFADNDHITSWRQDIAEKNKDQQPILEPPVTEYFVSIIYRVLGSEKVWYARYLTSLFWLIGGFYLYKTTNILLPGEAPLFATAFYLFVPIGIVVSRGFQPEALMMMMFLISLYHITRYFETLTSKDLFLSATITGLTILIKPLVIFVLLCSFIAISIYKKGSLSRALDKASIFFIGISFIIPFVYYGYGILVADYMRWKVAHSFRPHLFTHYEYWIGWLNNGIEVIGASSIFAALLGFFLMKNNLLRSLVIGSVVGYILFGLVFNYHIMTHNYYQIQILPIIGICAAPLITNTMTAINRMTRHKWLPVFLILIFGLYVSHKEVKESLYRPVFETPGTAREIGELVNHSSSVVTVAYEYGLPLSYYGEFSGTWWLEGIENELFRHPNARELSVQERLDRLGFIPEYFVITNFDLYHRKHQDLKAYLENLCSPIAETNAYLIYANCEQ